MSQLDLLLAELREARPIAPAELREHIRAIAAEAAPPRQYVTWRRALVVAVPLAAAIAGAAILLPGGSRTASPPPVEASALHPPRRPRTRTHLTSPARRPQGERSAGDLRNRRIGRQHQRRAGSRARAEPRPDPAHHDLARASRPEHAGRLRRHEEGRRDRPRTRRLPLVAERPGRRANRLRRHHAPDPEAERPARRLPGSPRSARSSARTSRSRTSPSRSTRPPARSRGSRRGSPTGRPSRRATRPPATSRRSRRRSRS